MLPPTEEIQRMEEALKENDRPPPRPAQERAGPTGIPSLAEALQGMEG